MGTSVSDVPAAYMFRVFTPSTCYSHNVLCTLIVRVIVVTIRLIMSFPFMFLLRNGFSRPVVLNCVPRRVMFRGLHENILKIRFIDHAWATYVKYRYDL